MAFARKQRKGKNEFRQIFCHHCNNDFSLQSYTFKQENKSRNYRYGHKSKSKEDKSDKLHARIPLILHCGHSVCEVCVYKEIKESTFVTCSQCNRISKVNSELKMNIRKMFPINFYYVGMLYYNEISYEDCLAFQPATTSHKDMLKRLNSKEELCAECRSDSVKWYCNECTLAFCVKCFGIVHKPTCFSHHKARHIEQSRNHQFSISLPICEKHTKKVQFYCVKCQEMLCGHCVLELHENHNIQELKVKNQESLPEFNMLVAQVKQTLSQLQRTKQKVDEEVLHENKYKVNRINERITDHFMQLHGRLQMTEKQLQKQIEERSLLSKNHLIELQSQLKENIFTIENLLEISLNFIIPENVAQLNLLGFMNNLENALKMQCNIVGERNSDADSTELVINEQFMSLIDEHCSLIFPQLKTFTFSSSNVLSDDIETLSLNSDQDGFSTTTSNKSDYLKEATSTSSLFSNHLSKDIELKTNKFTTGAFLSVLVTHVTSPSLFYIQHDDDSHLLSSLEQAMNRYAKATKVPNEVKLNEVYIVQFEDNKWYRAIVKSVTEDEIRNSPIYTVFYIDYGNEQNISMDKLRPISDEFLKYPHMAHKCCLFNISPANDQWSKDSVRIMAKMLDGMMDEDSFVNQYHQKNICVKAFAAIMDISDEILHVDLVTNPHDSSDLSASVRDALIFLNFGCFVKKIETEIQPCLINESQEHILHHKNFKVNDEFLAIISHINSPSSFYIQMVIHASYLEDIMQNMKRKYNHFSNKGIIYTPKYGMLCAVNTDSKWYRGYIIDLPGKKQLDVFLLDYGNIVTVDWLNIRKLCDEFLKFDVQAIHCCLNDVKPMLETWSSESINYFTKIVQNKVLQININNTEVPNEVTVYERKYNRNLNINALLVKKDLAISTGENSTFLEYYPLDNNTSECEVEKTSLSLGKNSSEKVLSKNEPYRVSVKVLSAQSPSCIYVCLQSHVNVIKEMQQNINRFYGGSKYEENIKWQINDKCAIHSEIDELWYRGIICELIPNNYKVFIKDFARLETVKESRLRQLDEQFLNVRDGAVKCHMWGIQAAGDRGEWPMLACEKLQNLFDIYSSIFITKRGPLKDCSLPVDIWVEHKILGGPLEPTRMEFRLVNQILIDDGVVIPIKQEVSSKFETKIEKSIYDETNSLQIGGNISEWLKLPVQHNFEKYSLDDSLDNSLVDSTHDWLSPLPFEENIEFSAVITHIDDNMNFYLYNVEMEEPYEQINSLIENVFENSPSQFENISWQQGQACVVRVSSEQTNFFRGKVVDVLKNIIEVHLVDHGNTLLCDSSELRKASILKDLPIKVTKCRLYEVESTNETWPLFVISLIRDAVLSENVIVNIKKQDSTKSYTGVSIYTKKNGNISEYLLSTNLAKLKNKEKIIKFHTASGNNSGTDNNLDIESDVNIEDNIIIENRNTVFKHLFIDNDVVKNNEVTVDKVNFDDDSCLIDKNVISEEDSFSNLDDLESTDNLGYRLIELPQNCKELEVTTVSLSCDDCCTWYVQPEAVDSNLQAIKVKYNTLLSQIQQEAPNQDIITEPTVGQQCVAKFNDDGQWYRGEIITPIFLNKDDLFILFVDYGNIDTVQRSDVRKTKPTWVNVPIQCFKCKLWNVKKSDCVDEKKCISELSSVLLNVKSVMHIKRNKPLQVELLHTETGQLLYQPLIDENILQYC